MNESLGLVFHNENGWKILASHIKKMAYSQIFIVVDENTEAHCLGSLYKLLQLSAKIEVLKTNSGEENKNITTCLQLWTQLSEYRADRNSLIINLGGGVITDLGGFVASTYKRGIDFVNIPTTLLAMVDAAIGGKNGIDFGKAKNQIGTITLPKIIVVENSFLETLPLRQTISGMAEMLKHSLISDLESWTKIADSNPWDKDTFPPLIAESIAIKEDIVAKDPLETGRRKTLNYGHTLGHAIESYCLENPERKSLLHGEAVAIGLILATYISNQLLGFPENRLFAVAHKITSIFSKEKFFPNEIEGIIKFLVFDKKNRNGQVMFVLLEDIGMPKVDCIVSNELIYRGFEFYEKL